MTTDLLTRARAGDQEAFRQLVEPYRHHLQLHCYRILGSVHDAEDALQETLLSAWQGLGGFEERASVRTWLYRVAGPRHAATPAPQAEAGPYTSSRLSRLAPRRGHHHHRAEGEAASGDSSARSTAIPLGCPGLRSTLP